MNQPFTSTLDPSVGQYYTPMAGNQDSSNPNPNPVMTSANNPLGWANFNTYAPWMTPNGITGDNPSFSSMGAPTHDTGISNSGLFGMGGSWLNLGKKMSSPNFYAPSYQGTLFQPSNGYGANYSMSQGGMAASQQASTPLPGQGYSPQQTSGSFSGLSGPQYAGGSGLSSNQSYIGQSPYGIAGQSYVPGQSGSSSSYGGYGNYGGYGSSNVGTQPYFPGQ